MTCLSSIHMDSLRPELLMAILGRNSKAEVRSICPPLRTDGSPAR